MGARALGIRASAFRMDTHCTCPDVVLNDGTERTVVGKNWSDACDEHGVGTDYFRALKVKPFGYGSEARTTRADWLKYLEKERQGR